MLCVACWIAAIAVACQLEHYLHTYHLDEGCRRGAVLGAETVQPDERAGIEAIIKTFDPMISRRLNGTLDDPEPAGLAKRVQHPVDWGCLKGSLTVDASLPLHLRRGLFRQPGAKFSALIRTAHVNFDADSDPKASSIAVKLSGVRGERNDLSDYPRELLEMNAGSQDFIFFSSSTFPFSASLQDVLDLNKNQLAGGVPMVLLGMLKHPVTFLSTLRILLAGVATTNPFLVEHSTAVASRLGGPETAAKLILRPCEAEAMPPAPKGQTRFVRGVVREHVNSHGVCMDVFVQRQRDACADSIENNYREWTGPVEHVGKLNVPAGSRTDHATCEFATFNPWNGLKEHQPLGWLSRARREAYKVAAMLRLQKSQQCPFFKSMKK